MTPEEMQQEKRRKSSDERPLNCRRKTVAPSIALNARSRYFATANPKVRVTNGDCLISQRQGALPGAPDAYDIKDHMPGFWVIG